MAESKINDIIKVSLEKIRDIVDAQTVIGTPIETVGGTTIIPVSKVTVGFASGGLDYAPTDDSSSTPPKSSLLKNANFSGGGGTGISVAPTGFLVISKDGKVDLLTMDNPTPGDSVDKIVSIVERSPEIISRLKDAFATNKTDSE